MPPPRSSSDYLTPSIFPLFFHLFHRAPSFFTLLAAHLFTLAPKPSLDPSPSPSKLSSSSSHQTAHHACVVCQSCPVDSSVSVGGSSISPSRGVKIVFIYHVLYGSLLVPLPPCGSRLSPSASLRFLCSRIHCALCSRLHRALCLGIHRTLCWHLLPPVFDIYCLLCLAFVGPVFAHASAYL